MNNTSEGIYFCSYCDIKCKTLWGFNGLKYHIDSKHPESSKKNFFCTKCNKSFIYNSSLKYHTTTSHSKHMCELCGIEYQISRSLQVHMAKNHNTGEEPVLICEKCDFTAPHKFLLQRHVLQKHDVDKHKKCPCCDFKTPQPQKLYIHIDNHHPEYDDKKYSCDKCGKGFIYDSSLKNHTNSTCKFSDYIKNVKNPKRKLKPKKPKKSVKCDYCCVILNGSNMNTSCILKVMME